MQNSNAQQILAFLTTVPLESEPPLALALSLPMLAAVPAALPARQRLVTFLREHHIELLHAGDLTSAFAVFDALDSHDPAAITGQSLGELAKRLMSAETAPGGPYLEADGRLEPVANAFIARCLARHAQVPAPLSAYVQTATVSQSAYSQPVAKVLLAAAQNPLEPVRLASKLATQLKSIWLTAAFACHGSGSSAKNRAPAGRPSAKTSSSTADAQAVFGLVEGVLATLAEPLRGSCRQSLAGIRRADRNHEISLLATYFGRSLSKKTNARMLTRLGAANVFCWMAYSIFDDFLDQEGSPAQLPVATFCLQQTLGIYAAVGSRHPALKQLTRQTFAAMDAANAWEVAHCRAAVQGSNITLSALPHFGARDQLAQRSYAHVLGPLAVLASSGVELGSRPAQHLQRAFKHYLIARQLNDDIHDWQADLASGQITYVVASLLRLAGVQPDHYELGSLRTTLAEHFWREGLSELCQQVLHHIAAAKRLLARCGLLASPNTLEAIFDDIASSASKALERHQDDKLFLRTVAPPGDQTQKPR